LLGPVISRFFACSNEEKNKPRQQSMCALVLSLWQGEGGRNFLWKNFEEKNAFKIFLGTDVLTFFGSKSCCLMNNNVCPRQDFRAKSNIFCYG
jgi:hypothetical protein